MHTLFVGRWRIRALIFTPAIIALITRLSIVRNGSIAWNHPLPQYDVHGIQQEPSPAASAAGSGVFGEAGRMGDKKGRQALRVHAQRRREVVQERPDGRMEKN